MLSRSRPVAPQIDASLSRRSRPAEDSCRAPAKAALKVEDYLEQPSSNGGDARLLTSRLYVSFAEFSSSALEQLHIAAPYVRTEALDVILRPINIRDVNIITTWTVHDLLQGASDLNLYPYLRSHGWNLYLHSSLHAKVLVADMNRGIVTSANMTKQGLGLTEPSNKECACRADGFSFSDSLWLSVLLKESVLVNDEYFLALKRHVERQRATGVAVEEFDSTPFIEQQRFSLSSLPMSESPSHLLGNIEVVADGMNSLSQNELSSTLHDMALFSLDGTGGRNQNEVELRQQFFAQPFVQGFVNAVTPRMYFGEAKGWLQSRCADIPTPTRRNLTSHVQILFRWIADFNRDYRVERPHYSQCVVQV